MVNDKETNMNYFKGYTKEQLIGELIMKRLVLKQIGRNLDKITEEAQNDYASLVHAGMIEEEINNMCHPTFYYVIKISSPVFTSDYIVYSTDETHICKLYDFIDVCETLSNKELKKSLFESRDICEMFLKNDKFIESEELVSLLKNSVYEFRENRSTCYDIPFIMNSLSVTPLKVLVDRDLSWSDTVDDTVCENDNSKESEIDTKYMIKVNGDYILLKIRDNTHFGVDEKSLESYLNKDFKKNAYIIKYPETIFDSREEVYNFIEEFNLDNGGFNLILSDGCISSEIIESIEIVEVDILKDILDCMTIYQNTIYLTAMYRKHRCDERSSDTHFLVIRNNDKFELVEVKGYNSHRHIIYNLNKELAISSSDPNDIRDFYYKHFTLLRELVREYYGDTVDSVNLYDFQVVSF
jgi:hypothetical protein